MLPVYVGAGNPLKSGAAGTAPWPTGHAAGDIGILLVQTNNQAIVTPPGWTAVPNSAQGTGTAGALGSTGIALFWRRASSDAEAAADIADSGDHQCAQVFAFRYCVRTGVPYDVTAGDTGASNTAVSIPGGTTTKPDCLVVAVCGDGLDLAGARLSSAANASLANVTERADDGTAANNGGGFAVITGEKATAGVVNATTGTLSSASLQARAMLALVGRQLTMHASGHTSGHVVGHVV